MDGDGTNEPGLWEEKQFPLLPADSIIRQKSLDNGSPLPMSTFGKDGRSPRDMPDGRQNGHINHKDLEIILPSSPSSDGTDDLSTLGIRMKEFPDPLASWEDLEPELNSRRSRNLDLEREELQLRPDHSLLSPTHVVRLSGPTGYPVTIPSPKHSPYTSIQKLHLHTPNHDFV